MAKTRARSTIAVCVLVALVAACSGDSDDDASANTSTTVQSSVATTTSTTEPEPVAIPDSPAGDALLWLLDSAGTEPHADEVSERFDEPFLAEVPPEQIIAIVEGLGADHHLAEILHATDTELVAVVHFGELSFEVQLAVEPAEPHRFVGLLLTPFVSAPDPPTSIDDVGPAWSELAPFATLLVAEIANGECRPIVDVSAERYGPIGSTFKLYVLGAVANAVEAGTIAWDDPLPIRDELKSHPSGTFQELPAGADRTVEQHARAMIELSDNTAADHLIDLVGREAVEQAVVDLGHSNPALNRPFLTTRELFLMKMGGVDDELDAYLNGDEDERRALLDSWSDRALPPVDQMPATATYIDELEWFASPNDLCQAMAVLEELSRWPGLEPLDAILTAPPALADAVDATMWFKGGSEPGVLNATMLAIDDTTKLVVTGTLTDPVALEVNHTGAVRWLSQVAGLLLG